jgi:hypothetical protein
MTFHAVTANRLLDGEVVYLTPTRDWSPVLDDCCVVADAAAGADLLAAATRAVQDRVVLDPYLFEIIVESAAISPLSRREIIRAAGPSVRPDLGRQPVQPEPVWE